MRINLFELLPIKAAFVTSFFLVPLPGVYTCQARMTTGGPTLSKDATIVITEKPHFKTHMAVSTAGEFGKAITVQCDVHGVPAPNVTWFRNGIPLSETPNLR